jgi:hypothetical protein
MMLMAKNSALRFEGVHTFVQSFLQENIQAKRVDSLAVQAIGQGLAHARGTLTKNGTRSSKSIDCYPTKALMFLALCNNGDLRCHCQLSLISLDGFH